MGLALILSISSGGAGVGAGVIDYGLPQSEAEVSGLQSVGSHRCSVEVNNVLFREIVPALQTQMDCRAAEVLAAPNHCCGVPVNVLWYLTGQHDRLRPLIHLQPEACLKTERRNRKQVRAVMLLRPVRQRMTSNTLLM